jgi:thioredoxin reductase (NADPH)
MNEPTVDVIVVGAGPIGIEMAVALKRAGIDYLHFDAKQVGQTISWFAPQTRFFSSNERIAIAGVPLQTPDQNKATREQYLAYLRQVVMGFDLKVRTYEPIVGVERGGEGFRITTESAGGRKSYRCRKLVLVTGGTDKPRRLNVPGEDLPHVAYYFDEPHRYFRKRVLVVGGKNSAVEAALRCHQAGAEVAISYRREKLPERSIKYWLLPEINGLIEAGKIKGYFGTIPAAIEPTRVRMKESPFCKVVGDCPSEVDADFVLALIGYEQDNALFKLAGIELRGDCQAPVFNPETMETNIPGLHVAGTAVGGTQDKYTVFIENCHVHVDRIVSALTGAAPPPNPTPLAMPES